MSAEQANPFLGGDVFSIPVVYPGENVEESETPKTTYEDVVSNTTVDTPQVVHEYQMHPESGIKEFALSAQLLNDFQNPYKTPAIDELDAQSSGVFRELAKARSDLFDTYTRRRETAERRAQDLQRQIAKLQTEIAAIREQALEQDEIDRQKFHYLDPLLQQAHETRGKASDVAIEIMQHLSSNDDMLKNIETHMADRDKLRDYIAQMEQDIADTQRGLDALIAEQPEKERNFAIFEKRVQDEIAVYNSMHDPQETRLVDNLKKVNPSLKDSYTDAKRDLDDNLALQKELEAARVKLENELSVYKVKLDTYEAIVRSHGPIIKRIEDAASGQSEKMVKEAIEVSTQLRQRLDAYERGGWRQIHAVTEIPSEDVTYDPEQMPHSPSSRASVTGRVVSRLSGVKL